MAKSRKTLDQVTRQYVEDLIGNNTGIKSIGSLQIMKELHTSYPFRVHSAGVKSGLSIDLQLFEKDFEYICRGSVQGFKILLHHPEDVPQVSKHFFHVPLGQEVLVSIQPEMITTKKGLNKYKPNVRGCYLEWERKLKFFQKYTQRNCELECLANFTYQNCSCVKFSMPSNE